MTLIATLAFILSVSWYAKDSQPSNAANYSECIKAAKVIAKGGNSEITPDVGVPSDNSQNNEANQKEYPQSLFDNNATCSDLKAQWAMADITHYAFWAAIVGVALVFFTLLYTARGVLIAKDTAKKQLKAWVSTTGIELKFSDEKDRVYGIVNFRNTGQTPAFSFTAINRIELLDPRVKNTFLIDHDNVSGAKASQSLGAGTGSWAETRQLHLSKSQMIDIEKGYLAIFVFGEAKYKDIYGETRTTKFRNGWGAYFVTMHGPVMGICAEGNEMT